MQEAIDFLTKKDAVFENIIALYGLPTIIRRKQGIETPRWRKRLACVHEPTPAIQNLKTS